MSKDIKWWLWEPSDWEAANGFKVRQDNCRHYVSEHIRSHQCRRKAKMTIQGCGFCTQHAKGLLARGYEEDKEVTL